eukprot:CAMPEP_0170484024 /NCGR_PEP_ID=MMETSP0208-20121228/3574_1 /TAXON_ID=197538 /ORGANISM="Strombidium inclinatum, Strain S3" /LENGTH=298 /DNA_ID=CAMNT_0010757251 /DNA_START=1168 /DNA_END=2064 /DNA_ORIENTATION=+
MRGVTAVRLLIFDTCLLHRDRNSRVRGNTSPELMNIVEEDGALVVEVRVALHFHLGLSRLMFGVPAAHVREASSEVASAFAQVAFALRPILVDGGLELEEVHGRVEAVHADRVVGLVVLLEVLLAILVDPDEALGVLEGALRLLVGSIEVIEVVGGVSGRISSSLAHGSQLVVDLLHVGDVLLVAELTSSVLSLNIRDRVFIGTDVSFGLWGGLVVPEEVLHLLEVLLHFEQLEELDEEVHEHPEAGRVLAVDLALGPAVEHHRRAVEHQAQELAHCHEGVALDDGVAQPDGQVEDVN